MLSISQVTIGIKEMYKYFQMVLKRWNRIHYFSVSVLITIKENRLTFRLPNEIPFAICQHYQELTQKSTLAGKRLKKMYVQHKRTTQKKWCSAHNIQQSKYCKVQKIIKIYKYRQNTTKFIILYHILNTGLQFIITEGDIKAARLPRTQEFSNQQILYRFIDLLHCNIITQVTIYTIITYMYPQYYCTNYCKCYGIPEFTRYQIVWISSLEGLMMTLRSRNMQSRSGRV